MISSIFRVQVDLQDLDGNTSAHLAVSGTAEPVENPYSNELSDIFEPVHLDRLSYLELSPGQILKVIASNCLIAIF